MEENYNGIFASGQPRHAEERESGNSKEYRVSYKQGKDGIYTSLIRFVINPRNPQLCIASKYVTWLKDPVTQKSRPVDNPRTVYADYNPIDSMFWPMFKSGNKTLENTAKECLSTSQQHVSIIQVLNDAQRPELNGKFLVFKYGKKIRDMINAEENGTEYTKARDPWDPFTGRAFMLQITNQGGNNNYDKSAFVDIDNPGLLYTTGQKDAAGKDILYSATPETDGIQAFLFKYLMDNCPDLTDYEYKPWDSQIEDYVNQTLQVIENYAKNGGVAPATNSFGINQSNVISALSGQQVGAAASVSSLLEAQTHATAQSTPQASVQVNNQPVVQPKQQIPASAIELPSLGTGTQAPAKEEEREPVNQFGDISSLIQF